MARKTKPRAQSARPIAKTVTPSGSGILLSAADLADNRSRMAEKKERARSQASAASPSRRTPRGTTPSPTEGRGSTYERSTSRTTTPPLARPARSSAGPAAARRPIVNVSRGAPPGRNSEATSKKSATDRGRR
jgi:hypothetical protein